MKLLAFILLGLSLMIGGLILQINIGSLNMSSWNFTGHEIARGLTEWLGGLLMLIGCGVIVIIGYSGRD